MNKLTYRLYSTFVKFSCTNISNNVETEDIYISSSDSNNRIIVFVKDKKIGRQIYDIVKTLSDRKQEIDCRHTRNCYFRGYLKFDNYFADNKKTVRMFSIISTKYTLVALENEFPMEDMLYFLVCFSNCMQDIGYVIDESKFENEKCGNISSMLSMFTLANSSKENSKGCLIKYIHYLFSNGGNLYEFYKEIINNNTIISEEQYPYSLPMIKMCYEYFTSGKVPKEDILCILEENLKRRSKGDYLIGDKNSFKAKYKIMTDNDEYTIYQGHADGKRKNIKIYHNMSLEFEDFLKNEHEFINQNSEAVIEQIDKIIADPNGHIIGYEFYITESLKECISFKIWKKECELLKFMKELCTYIINIKYYSQYQKKKT